MKEKNQQNIPYSTSEKQELFVVPLFSLYGLHFSIFVCMFTILPLLLFMVVLIYTQVYKRKGERESGSVLESVCLFIFLVVVVIVTGALYLLFNGCCFSWL